MTPQEISDYKQKWMPGYDVQIDMDSDVWGKNLARKLYNRYEWSFKAHSHPDDSHTFHFETLEMATEFYQEYKQYNANFSESNVPQFLINGKSTD